MTEMTAPATGSQTEGGRQYVTFFLNDEAYAIDALAVQEIIELGAITKVPHLPDFFKGVINLRGTIIPVIDLKRKFAMSSDEYKRHTCVVVTEVETRIMGLIVDAVSDVLHIAEESVSDTPSFGARVDTAFMKGMAKVDTALVIILDINKILSETDTMALAELQGGGGVEHCSPGADEERRALQA